VKVRWYSAPTGAAAAIAAEANIFDESKIKAFGINIRNVTAHG